MYVCLPFSSQEKVFSHHGEDLNLLFFSWMAVLLFFHFLSSLFPLHSQIPLLYFLLIQYFLLTHQTTASTERFLLVHIFIHLLRSFNYLSFAFGVSTTILPCVILLMNLTDGQLPCSLLNWSRLEGDSGLALRASLHSGLLKAVITVVDTYLKLAVLAGNHSKNGRLS